jgi:hypothetical protein
MQKNVRKVAAQTLGRTGKGKVVHDEILRRLMSKNVFDRCEALRKLTYIGVMTPSLLEAYLRCFRDDCISVRELACTCTQRLVHSDQRIIDALVFMVRFEKATKIKSLALRSKFRINNFLIYTEMYLFPIRFLKKHWV